jgi:hypothetical protein
MSELAYDENGQHFQVSATAARWRTRRFNNPGKPGGAQVVYGDDGLPLYLDIEATSEEFRDAVGGIPARYRLDAVDANGRPVDGMPPAYLVINGPATASGAGHGGPAYSVPPATSATEHALVEIARINGEAFKSVADKFGNICDALSNVVRAVDGAGLPRRAPLGPLLLDHPEQDDDDDDERNAAPPPREPTTLARVLAQAMQMVQMFTQMRGGDAARVGALTAKAVEVVTTAADVLDAPAAAEETSDSGDVARSRASVASTIRVPATSAPAADRGSPTAAPRTAAPAAPAAPMTRAPAGDPMAHVNQIMTALTPQEQARVEYVITTLPVGQLMQWYDQLGTLSVSDAVVKIRGELARAPMEQAA